MTRLAILLILQHLGGIDSYSASVNLILHNNRHWTSIKCPPIESGNRFDVTNNDQSISSTTHITFQCKIEAKNKTITRTPYHFSLIFPLILSSECPKMDECFLVRLRQNDAFSITVNVRAVKPCFSKMLSLRYELRQDNTLIGSGMTLLIIGKQPDPPNYLHFKMNGTQIQSLDGFIQRACVRDVLTSKYSMQFNIRGVKECQLTNQYSPCRLLNESIGKYRISCPIHTVCDPTAMCSAVVTAYIVGVNSIGQKGSISRRFSKSLAFTTGRSISPNITSRTLNSLTVTFLKPVTCTSAHQHFQYKVTYKKTTDANMITFQGNSCNNRNLCSAYLAGLEMSTKYTICVSYSNIFDMASSFGTPSCTNATTAQLPCQSPDVYLITPVKVDLQYWKAIVYWRTINIECWNDKLNGNRSSRYYRIEINDSNSTRTYRIASTANHTVGGLTYLRYRNKYSVTLSSCNLHGCINGAKSYLYIKHAKQASPTKHNNTKQKVTETVLICVLSLLFLAASTFLYFILKKRKQFQRLKLKRKLRAEDIQIVREEEQKILPRGLDTNIQVVKHNPERTIIKVDTRPLITHKTSIVECSIPKNSTLV